jgi:DNA repair protein RecO (recombination protein O)
MRSYTDLGIVIKRVNYGEGDKLITLFSGSHGKVTLKAKGIRKQTSKRAGTLDLFNYIKFHVVSGRGEIDTLTEVESISDFSAWKVHLGRVNIAYQLCELVDKLTPDKQPHPEIFEILLSCLQAISKLGSDWEFKISNFKFQILTELGYWKAEQEYSGDINELAESVSERPLHAHKILRMLK